MRPSNLSVCVIAALALSTMGCKLKLDAKVKGFKEGSIDTVIVHVTSDPGAEITCTPCKPGLKMPDSGELDIEAPFTEGGSKTLFINGKKSLKKGSTYVDLGGTIPVKLAVDPAHGTITCQPRECTGTIDLAPSSKVFFKSEPGTILQIGNEKLTATDGTISSPLLLTMTPSLDKQLLDHICVGFTVTQTSTTMVTAPVTITFPDKALGATKAELQLNVVEKSLASYLAKVTTGPVLFPWEKPGQPARGKRAAAFVYADDCYDAGATGATVADLDVIAVATATQREGVCSFISKSSTATGKMMMNDLTATVYDRITGKKLGTKFFPAPKDCIDSFTAQAGTTTAPDSHSWADKEGVAKWAAAFAR
jgi:hypothetical protein